jgi:hypothetical protein
VTIATDDQGISDALGSLVAAQRTGAAELGQHLTAAPKLLAQRYRHRAAVKKLLETDGAAPKPRSKRR